LHRGSTFYFTLRVEPTSVTASPSGGFNRNVTES